MLLRPTGYRENVGRRTKSVQFTTMWVPYRSAAFIRCTFTLNVKYGDRKNGNYWNKCNPQKLFVWRDVKRRFAHKRLWNKTEKGFINHFCFFDKVNYLDEERFAPFSPQKPVRNLAKLIYLTFTRFATFSPTKYRYLLTVFYTNK